MEEQGMFWAITRCCTMNWGNFELWSNFEHHTMCSFNELYYENGRVYQKLYFFSCSAHHRDHIHTQNMYI